MPTLIPLAEVELEFLIEESVVLPCDSPECDNQAVWSLRCEACQGVILACDPCRRSCEADLEGDWVPFCLQCEATLPMPLRWLPL